MGRQGIAVLRVQVVQEFVDARADLLVYDLEFFLSDQRGEICRRLRDNVLKVDIEEGDQVIEPVFAVFLVEFLLDVI